MGAAAFDTSTLISPPLAGRTEELAWVAEVRELGSACGVVIEGPAGVGKSRLAREAVQVAAEQGAFVEWMHATRSAATVPMAAAVSLLDGVDAETPLGILHSCGRVLRDRAGSRAIVLGVDDAHLLDLQSASLVFHLAASSTAFVVVTVRTHEQCPDAVVSLWKDLGAARLELTALDEEQTCELLESSLGGPVEQAMRRWAFEHSRGNVLYLREMLLGAATGGAVSEVAGLWRLSRRPRPSRPLVELVAERMAGLDEPQRRVLDLLAIGEPLLLSETIELAGSGPVAAAEASGVIAVRGREVSLAHPLYGEVVAAQMPAIRTREVRLTLAQTVRAREPGTPEDTLRIARWLLDADEPIPAETLLEAARAAILGGDPDFGALLAEQALIDRSNPQASSVLARAHIMRRRYEDADAVLVAAEPGLPSPAEALQHLEQHTTMLFWGLKRPEEALALLERAEGWWPDTTWRRGLSPLQIHLTALTQGWDAAVGASELALAEPELDPETRRRLEPVHATNLFYSGRWREAVELAAQTRPAVPLRDQTDTLAFAFAAMADVEVGIDWPGLEAWIARSVADAVRADDHEAIGLAALAYGYLRYMQGRYRDAARWLGESELPLERRDMFGALVMTLATRIGVALATGDAETAAATFERCRIAVAEREPLPSLPVWVARAEGWAARATGNSSKARSVFMEAAEQMGPVYGAPLYHEALRFGEPARNVVERLEAEHARADVPLVAAYADRARGLADGDGNTLLACAAAFETIGATRFASESAAEAAEAFVQAGRQDSARRAAARSRELYNRTGEGDPPGIEGVDGISVELTAREAEIVELAGRGLSNSEIAEQLVVSVRTVESHLYRAMIKLGISDRRDLGDQPLV